MDWDQIEAKWKQTTGRIQQQWDKVTDGDLKKMDDSRGELVGESQTEYGVTDAEAEKQVDTLLSK